jgi:diphthamide biosynthesis methyltransferase
MKRTSGPDFDIFNLFTDSLAGPLSTGLSIFKFSSFNSSTFFQTQEHSSLIQKIGFNSMYGVHIQLVLEIV